MSKHATSDFMVALLDWAEGSRPLYVPSAHAEDWLSATYRHEHAECSNVQAEAYQEMVLITAEVDRQMGVGS